MNLTNQQIQQVFHIYSKADILYEGEIWEGITESLLNGNDPSYFLLQEDCQLLLRSIDQLTEEEKRGLINLIGWNKGKSTFDVSFKDGEYIIKRKGVVYDSSPIECLPYPAVDYLRSLEPPVALPFYIEGKVVDLFEEGVAKRIEK